MLNLLLPLIIIFIRCSTVDAVTSQASLQMVSVAGRMRAYHLGEVLRAKYDVFLGDIYDSAAVSARSTEYDRAKMSLQLLLAALYKPQKHQKWHESLAWQPIPYSYNPRDQDMLLFPRYCPRFFKELQRVKATPEYQKLLDPLRDVMDYIEFFTGKEIRESFDMFLLYHELKTMQSANVSIPRWAQDIFPDGLLLNATFLEYKAMKFNDWMRRVNGGAFLRKTIDDMLTKVNDSMRNQKKIYLYSSHELIITGVLQSLKIWEPHVPEYTSAIVIELYEASEDHFVKVLYYKGIPATIQEMQVSNCSVLCSLEQFMNSVSDELPNDDEIICEDEPITMVGDK